MTLGMSVSQILRERLWTKTSFPGSSLFRERERALRCYTGSVVGVRPHYREPLLMPWFNLTVSRIFFWHSLFWTQVFAAHWGSRDQKEDHGHFPTFSLPKPSSPPEGKYVLLPVFCSWRCKYIPACNAQLVEHCFSPEFFFFQAPISQLFKLCV